jgi:peptidoglycan-associated lipoprotein
MKKPGVFLFSLISAFTAGCASNDVSDPAPEDATTVSDAATDPYAQGGLNRGGSLADDTPTELGTVIYFDFDQAELKPEYVDLLARHADRMAGRGDLEVRLEGHADERGSREYNIGLGERRSQAVRRILVASGVSADRLSTVSFGEERPAIAGSSEQSYAANRRVEITYLD